MKGSNLRRTPKVFGTSYRPKAPRSQKRDVQISAAWRPVVIVAILVAGLFLIGRLPFFQIKTVTLNGIANPHLAEELEGLVGRSIFSSHISFITSKWLVDDPSLAALACRRGLPSSITCESKSRQGVLLWKSAGEEYWIDESGRAFSKKAAADPPAPLVEDRLNQLKIGDYVASAEIVEMFLRLHKLLADRSIVMRHFFITDALYQPSVLIDAFPTSANPALRKEVVATFAATEALEAQVQTLTSLLAERGERIGERIDLRVPGYVYYR